MGNKTVIRHMIGDYLKIGATEDTPEIPKYALMGAGFKQLDESPNAQTESEAYISDRSTTTTIVGYDGQYAFDTKFISDEAAVAFIYNIARNQLTGADAETDYVRVDLFEGEEGSTIYPARKIRIAVEVSSIEGEGGKAMRIKGNLRQVGDLVNGTFDTAKAVANPAEDAFTAAE